MHSEHRDRSRPFTLLFWLALASSILPLGAVDKAAARIDFNAQIRPLLSQNCFACHGPDDAKRKGGLRLDLEASATAPAKSGARAIVPGAPDQSELLKRVLHPDESERMPPASTGKHLTEAQITLFRRWISEGAHYEPHWAFVPPKFTGLPPVRQKDWPRNAIDYFVLARLEKEGLSVSPPADRATLVRRVYLDLIGLPPTPEEADAFLNDTSADAYESLIDQLLASPHYGERWGRLWLDLARYADTNGYEKDRPRSIWPYRDWVIAALNADMPFDQFTIEQLAGDMLPHATLPQRIATGFHRNTMLNEEGGIDPLEFRFHAMADRIGTTAKVWLGLTVACAQCHTHKFDPITHREYYQLMAFLNNADEPELDVPRPDIAARRAAAEQKIAQRVKELPERFPVDTLRWVTPRPIAVKSQGGAEAAIQPDGSVLFSGAAPATDIYELQFETDRPDISQVRLEAMTDASLPSKGPGRTDHGNFVLSEVQISAAPKDGSKSEEPVKLTTAKADFSQTQFPVAQAIDGDPKTGWAIHGEGNWNRTRTATFIPARPIQFQGGARILVKLEQSHGTRHTLGRVRISFGETIDDPRPIEVRRQEAIEQRFAAWLKEETARAVPWTTLRPVSAKANLPLLTIQEDSSVFASGDQTKSDTYTLQFRTELKGITALRLEALPDERLPQHGPGRIYYEGTPGDFFLSDFSVLEKETKRPLVSASHSFASGNATAATAIDSNLQTGWSINGAQGQTHHAVFNLAEPLALGEFTVRLLFERYYAAGLGRFRLAATTNANAQARPLSSDVQALLLIPPSSRTTDQREQLWREFLLVVPELKDARAEIDKLRRERPDYPTTLVMTERPPENPRPTFIHHRGEFLQPTETVQADVLSVLPPFGQTRPRNRLGFAQWLVAPENPLTARVTMNRQWAAFFGHGLVRTAQDFGFQGETPSHPELLDWLALQLIKERWSLKTMHRLIVMSATYQQASAHAGNSTDPENRLLARGPRVRLEAEMIRDAALRASGLFSPKVGGPSVYPPQPASVSTEGAYGRLDWKVSPGPDRYRRGLYTFCKRTAPYAMLQTFDAPSGESCVVQREVSNTPLQALTLLNDTVFMEAAQTLGSKITLRPGTERERLDYLFRCCLTRSPSASETTEMIAFLHKQKERAAAGGLDASTLAGPGEGEMRERAAWTSLARALLNLDEAITKN